MASSEAPEQALPVELCVLIIEHLANDVSLQLQLDLASLRLSSRLLHRVATAHFYKVIQLSHHSQTMNLVSQLQAKRKLCDSTRAVWWDQEAPFGEAPDIEVKTPYLVRFANVDEVGCITTGAVKGKIESRYPVGLHFALRDVGAWCEPVRFLRPWDMVDKVQQTPTLRVSYEHAKRDASLEMERYLASVSQYRADHDGQSPPHTWTRSHWAHKQPSRSIWAMHVVVPGLRISDMFYYHSPRTVTHLTITLYQHSAVGHEPNVEQVLEDILDLDTLQLLQHLHIRCINFGARSGPPSKEERDPYRLAAVFKRKERKKRKQAEKQPEDAEWETESDEDDKKKKEFYKEMERLAALEDEREWQWRLEDIQSAIRASGDPRVTFEAIKLDGLRAESLMEDVRKFTLHEWQERVYHGRDGPWKAPMTQSVRVDPPSGPSVAGDEEEENVEESE